MFKHLLPIEQMKLYAEIENKRARACWGHVNLQNHARTMPNKGGRNPTHTSDKVKRMIVKMRSIGSTKAEISKLLGVTDHTIRCVSAELKNQLKISN